MNRAFCWRARALAGAAGDLAQTVTALGLAKIPERYRWRAWSLACRSRRICPANTHSVLLAPYPGGRVNPFVDRECRADAERAGSCWCGRLRTRPAERSTP